MVQRLRWMGLFLGFTFLGAGCRACCGSYVPPTVPASLEKCSEDVLVGFSPNAGTTVDQICPLMQDWTAQLVFAEPSVDLTGFAASDAVNDLKKLCRYYKSGPNPKTAVFEWLGRSCQVVMVHQTTNPKDAFKKRWETAFKPGPYPGPGADVRVAVIDTAQTQSNNASIVHDKSRHGRMMGEIIKYAACPAGPPCPKVIFDFEPAIGISVAEKPTAMGPTLLLSPPIPIDGAEEEAKSSREPGKRFYRVGPFDPTARRDGHVGDQVMLAEAIIRILRGWQGTSMPSIINLSIGWDARHGTGAEPEALKPAPGTVGSRAAMLAIEIARQQNVLVLAAAGNRGGRVGDHGAGPTYPAAGMRRMADARVNLWAIGGVDFNGDQIGIARDQSEPRLVAPAVHFSRKVTAAPAFESTMSGTSVSTAISAGMAARLWASNAALKPEDVMNQLYAGGVEVGRGAQFCPLAGSGESCPKVKAIGIPAPGSVLAKFPDPPPNPKKFTLEPTSCEVPPECGVVQYYGKECGRPVVYCADRELDGRDALPFVVPHPGDDECPDCFIASNFMHLAFDVDPSESLTDVVVTVKTASQVYSFNLVEMFQTNQFDETGYQGSGVFESELVYSGNPIVAYIDYRYPNGSPGIEEIPVE